MEASPTSSNQVFNYSDSYAPLTSSRKEIRLLWLIVTIKEQTSTSKSCCSIDTADNTASDEDNSGDDTPIHTTLETVSLLDNPAYVALSYTWGDPFARYQPRSSREPHLLLSGQRVEVRPNLYDFLQNMQRHIRTGNCGNPCGHHLRSLLQPLSQEESEGKGVVRLPLWIDALCINQSDVLERNSQVMLMGDIYRGAAAVVSWLGEHRELTCGLRIISELARRWRRYVEEIERKKECLKKSREKEHASPPTANGNTKPDAVPGLDEQVVQFIRSTRDIWHNEQALISLLHVFRAKYWRRIWIVQEMVLADPESHLFMTGPGPHMAPISDMRVMIICLTNFWRLPASSFIHIGHEGNQGYEEKKDALIMWKLKDTISFEVYQWWVLQKLQRGEQTPSLMFVLNTAFGHDTTEPLDAVYGLLNLLPPDHGIVPDYQRSVRDVYIDWAVRTMRESGNLNLLTWNWSKKRSGPDFGLPSWVPDLFNSKSRIEMRDSDWERAKGAQNTRGDLSSSESSPFQIDISHNGALKLRARRRATIRSVTDMPEEGFLEGQKGFHPLLHFCFSYLRERAAGRGHPASLPPLQVLIRLLLPGLFHKLSAEEPEKGVHKLAGAFIQWLVFRCMKANQKALPLERGSWVGEFFANLDKLTSEGMENLRNLISTLGLSLGNNFPEAYQRAVISDVDVTQIMRWSQLMDVFQDPEVQRLFPKVHMDILPLCIFRFFRTEEGYVGFGDPAIQPGDVIWEVKHCNKLLAFRVKDSTSVPDTVVLVGQSVVVGLCDEVNGHHHREYEELLIV